MFLVHRRKYVCICADSSTCSTNIYMLVSDNSINNTKHFALPLVLSLVYVTSLQLTKQTNKIDGYKFGHWNGILK